MIVDAYMHGGMPRFGNAADNLKWMDLHGVDRAVWVMGLFLPDLHLLEDALKLAPDRVRCVGVPLAPWHGNEAEALACVDEMLALGVIGFRLQGDEYLRCETLLQKAGEQNRWLYTIDPHDRPEITRQVLDWLEAYPEGRVMIPHHLHPNLEFLSRPGMEELLSHPRVFAIFSRQGGPVQSKYPHRELFPWVKEVLARMGEERVCWGSEFPVYMWRDESFVHCRDWCRELPPGVIKDHEAFLGTRAQNLLFEQTEHKAFRQKMEQTINVDGFPLPLKNFSLDSVRIPELMRAYRRQQAETPGSFFDFLNGLIEKGLLSLPPEN